MLKHLISAATADRGSPIDKEHLSIMEECFQTSFRDVRLHFTPASRVANNALSSLAFEVGNHICFRNDAEQSNALFQYLLAHELAHVVQKRRGSRQRGRALRQPSESALEAQLESEACVAAIAALSGKAAPPLTPDPCAVPRLYGPAGHYYTSFWACLAAGFDFSMAQRIAFYTQMPDQVKELDATAAGISMASSAGTVVANAPTDEYESPAQTIAKSNATQQAYQNISAQAIVQEGLHSLTGKEAETETQFRTDKLKDALAIQKCGEAISLRIGLAIHAFGDSFAHRDMRTGQFMYSPAAGHAVELLGPNDPHSPDNLHLRQPLYFRYANTLYSLLRAGTSAPATVSATDFSIQLQGVALESTDDTQADRILANITDILNRTGLGVNAATLGDFNPNTENRGFTKVGPVDLPPPWDQFKDFFKKLNLPPDTLQNSLMIAAEWAHSALTMDMIKQQVAQAVENVADSVGNFAQKQKESFDQEVDNQIYQVFKDVQPYTGDNYGL